MRNLKLILLLFCSIQICIGQIHEDEFKNLKTLNLKGNVKSITETSYNAKKSGDSYIKTTPGWQNSWKKNNQQNFDLYGNLIEQLYFENSKQIINEYFKYENNRLIEINALYANRFFTYDDLGRILTEKLIDKKPKTITTGKENILIKRETNFNYYYSENSKLIKKIESDLSGNQISIQNYKYDENDNLVYEEEKYSGRKEWRNYSYNKENLLTRTEWKDDEFGFIEVTTMIYNNKDKISEHWTNYEEGIIEGFVDYKYERGNEILTKESDAEGKIENIENISYKYDKFDNWINKTIILKNKVYIIERQINYY